MYYLKLFFFFCLFFLNLLNLGRSYGWILLSDLSSVLGLVIKSTFVLFSIAMARAERRATFTLEGRQVKFFFYNWEMRTLVWMERLMGISLIFHYEENLWVVCRGYLQGLEEELPRS